MPAVSHHSTSLFFQTPLNEAEIELWAKAQKDDLRGPATFGLLFCSPECADQARSIIEIIRIYAQVPVMIGCCAHGFIAGSREFEEEPGCAVALYHLPNTIAHARHLPTACFNSNNRPAAFRGKLGAPAETANAWLLFASADSIGHEAWLPDWDQAIHQKTTIGGFASVDPRLSEPSLFLNDAAFEEGAVALGLEGGTTIEPVLSQGCRPVGSPWTITKAHRNIIHQIGNRPVLEVLRDTLEGMSLREQQQARGNIFIGLVLDEYKPSFGPGDFLVRNLAAIDPKSGAVAIATPLRVGQNLQFQIRDARSASADLEEILRIRADQLRSRRIYGACLCDCIGRGLSLYGVPDHDVSTIDRFFPGLPVGGLFCNGEFGPANNRTLLHGYAASLALFVDCPEPH